MNSFIEKIFFLYSQLQRITFITSNILHKDVSYALLVTLPCSCTCKLLVMMHYNSLLGIQPAYYINLLHNRVLFGSPWQGKIVTFLPAEACPALPYSGSRIDNNTVSTVRVNNTLHYTRIIFVNLL